MSLLSEIQEAGKQISTDAYSMSVGELISMYKEGDLDIQPDFQRFFRWSASQKSRLVESLVLGLPVPPVFVYQTQDSKWEVIDGLQRISTVLELVGELKDADSNPKPPLVLSPTKYLPSLNGRVWDHTKSNVDKELELDQEIKLLFRRSRIDVRIVLSKSDPSSKYEMFDRLNTGGSSATEQEVRNCLLLMLNKQFFLWVKKLSELSVFKECIPITERQEIEQFGVELVVRFLIFRNASPTELGAIADLHSYLTQEITALAISANYNYEFEENIFVQTFTALARCFGDESFRKLDITKGRAVGPILLAAFEAIACGLATRVENSGIYGDVELVARRATLWTDHASKLTSVGMRASTRLAQTIKLGRQIFADENSDNA